MRSINKSFNITSYLTLENCLFGAVELTKHPDIDHYKYCGYGIGFDRTGFFSLGDEIGRNVIIFGVDMSSSQHIDDKKKDTLILGKAPTQGLEHTLTEERFIQLFVNDKEIIKFKAKDTEFVTFI